MTLWQRVLAACRAQSIANCRVCSSFADAALAAAAAGVVVVAMSHLRKTTNRDGK